MQKASTNNVYEVLYGTEEDPPVNSHSVKVRVLSPERLWVFHHFSPFRVPSAESQELVLEDTRVSQREAMSAWLAMPLSE